MSHSAIQDQLAGIHCFGCGPENQLGLRIKSRWSGEGETLCRFQPEAHHCAGPKRYVNGGIIATVVDCHCVCTAIAEGYRRDGREVGVGEAVLYVTGSLRVTYLAPAPIDTVLELRARFASVQEKKIVLTCEVTSGDTLVAAGEVVAVRVTPEWGEEEG